MPGICIHLGTVLVIYSPTRIHHPWSIPQANIIIKVPQHWSPVYPIRSGVLCARICIMKATTCTGISVFQRFPWVVPQKKSVGTHIRRMHVNRKRDQNKQVTWDACGLAPPWASLHADTKATYWESDAAFGIRYPLSFLFSSFMPKSPIAHVLHVQRKNAKSIKFISDSSPYKAKSIPIIMSSKQEEANTSHITPKSHTRWGGAYKTWFNQARTDESRPHPNSSSLQRPCRWPLHYHLALDDAAV